MMKSFLLANEPTNRIYDIMSGSVVPRPIAFVSTLSADGIQNLAPFSFFNIGGANPPSLTICTVLGSKGEPKDTYANIAATGEFVVNLVTRAMADGMNRTAPSFPGEIDEWPISGFSAIPSTVVKPARVAESPVQMECRLFKTMDHGDGPGASRYIVGEILAIHVAESFDANASLLARLGGAGYLDLAGPEIFELQRPQADPSVKLSPAPGEN